MATRKASSNSANKVIVADRRHKNRLVIGLGVAAGIILLGYYLRDILSSLLIAFVIAFIINPFVDWIEHFGVRRSRAIVFMLACMALLFAFFFVFAMPVIFTQLNSFVEVLPEKLHRLYAQLDFYLRDHYRVELPSSAAELLEKLRYYISTNHTQLLKQLTTVLQGTATSTMTAVMFILNLVLIPMLTIYLLYDFHKIMAKLHGLVPRRFLPKYDKYVGQLNSILVGFFRGQLLLVVIMSLYYSIGFFWVGIPLWLFVGMVSGVGHFIPYLGPASAFLLGVIMVFADFENWLQLFRFAVVIMSAQLLESFILTPRLVGERLGLHAVTTILALMVFGKMFGFFGILMAIPVAALLKMIIKDLEHDYKQSRYYLGS